MRSKYIVIEGNIGVGKTTLANKLAKALNGYLLLEKFEDNMYLPKFYDSPQKYAFQLELSFMIDRFNQIKDCFNNIDSTTHNEYIVSDYSFIKTLIFASNNLSGNERYNFTEIFSTLNGMLPKPNFIIYLDADTDVLKERIICRGRDYERNIEKKYLNSISEKYLQIMDIDRRNDVMHVYANNLNLLNSEEEFEAIVKAVINCKMYSFEGGKGTFYNPPVN